MTATRTKGLNIRTTPEKIEGWRAAAKRDGRSLTSWVERQLDTAMMLEGPIADVDKALREYGGDPVAIGKRGAKLAARLLKKRKEDER